MARPKFQPTQAQRDMVRGLAGMGMEHEKIRLLVKHPNGKPITAKTLRRHFRAELDEGGATVQGLALGKFMKHMQSRNERVSFDAIRFYLQTQHGWKIATSTELTGRDGGPLQTQDVGSMTKEEKAAAFAKALVVHFKSKGLPRDMAEAMGIPDGQG